MDSVSYSWKLLEFQIRCVADIQACGFATKTCCVCVCVCVCV